MAEKKAAAWIAHLLPTVADVPTVLTITRLAGFVSKNEVASRRFFQAEAAVATLGAGGTHLHEKQVEHAFGIHFGPDSRLQDLAANG